MYFVLLKCSEEVNVGIIKGGTATLTGKMPQYGADGMKSPNRHNNLHNAEQLDI